MTRFVKKHNIALLPLLFMLVLFPLQASAEDYSCAASIPVRVSLIGEVDADFAVQISSDEGAPLPEETSLTLHGRDEAAFGAITYTKPGDYAYTVLQQGGEVPYLTYDDTVYQVIVRVTNTDEGGLAPEIWATKNDQDQKVAELVFTNTYNPPTPPSTGTEQPSAPDTEQTPPAGTDPNGGAGGSSDGSGQGSGGSGDGSGQNGGSGATQLPATGQEGTATATSSTSPVSSLLQRLPIPQTGDQFPLVLLVVVMCAAVAGFGYSYYRKHHSKKGGSDSSSGAAQ